MPWKLPPRQRGNDPAMKALKRLGKKLGGDETPAIPGVRVGERVSLRYAQLTAAGGNSIDEGSKISGKVSLGYATTIGRYAELVGGSIDIGAYCSLAPHVAVYALNHPTNHLTTYLGQGLWKGELKKHQTPQTVKIGSDVWLGHGAIVLAGVQIGHGAVLGAGAVVTRNIAPYSVALGNPARVVKRRFSEEIADLLLQLRWWEFGPEQLRTMEDLFHLDFAAEPKQAVERLRYWIQQYRQEA